MVLTFVAVIVVAGCSGGSSGVLAPDEQLAADRFVNTGHLFDSGLRLCAAPRVVRAVGVARLDAITAGAAATAAETQAMYAAFARCGDLEAVLVAAIVAPAAPTRDQLACLVAAHPLGAETKAVVLARLAGGELPALSAAVQSRFATAYVRCLSVEQRHLLGA